MKNSLLSLCIGLLLSNLAIAQFQEECASELIHKRLMENNPLYAQQIQSNEYLIQQYLKNNPNNKSGNVLTIPLVVHVIHTGQSVGTGANISMTQINSAIDTLNARYRNLHGQSEDTEIEFVLAQRDPDGNATTGVVRVDGSNVTNYSTEGITAGNGSGADEASVKALSRWPSTQYYNIWVVTEIENNNGGFGIQGYAYFPGASPAIDGTVIMNTCFGTTGTVNSFNNRNRTLVHEIGHAFNLYHTFEGDEDGTTCPTGNGDFVADTDPHIRASSNCPSGTNSCTGGSIDELTENYMNYSNQSCAVKFTPDQTSRMRAAILASRPSLTTSLGSIAPASDSVPLASCTPTTSNTNNGFGFGIYEVSLNNVTVVSDGVVDEGDYINHTKHQTIELTEGNTYTLNVESGPANNENIEAYIDYNNDGDFNDTNENILSSSNAIDHSGNFSVPSSGITTGSLLRMRVIGDWHNNTITGPCYNPTYGQTEDYAVYISAATSPLSASISSSTNVSCFGSSDGSLTASASGGTTPYTYSWSSGALTPTNSGLIAGTYTVTVSDASGSTATASSTITEPTEITVSLTVSDESCVGGDGAITTNASGGAAPYTYSWSNGAFTANISNLSGGNYTVTVSDNSGCTTSQSTSVGQASCDTVNLTLRDEDCGRSNIDPIHHLLIYDTRSDATNYRVRVNGGSVSNFVLVSGNDNFFNINEITGVDFNTTYTVEVAAFINGQWSSYGDPCNITTTNLNNAVNIKLRTNDCGRSNIDPNHHLLIYNTRSDATNYRVRVNGGSVSNFVLVSGNDNFFNINEITGVDFNTTYTVEVAAFINGQWSNYGDICNISTANLGTAINLTLRDVDCGRVNIDPIHRLLIYDTRSDATNYRVRVNGGSVSNFVLVSGNDNFFNINEITGVDFNTTYTVEVAAFISGQWSNYGNPCNITTATLNNAVNIKLRTNDCGRTNVDPSNRLLIYNTRSDATNYRVRVNGGSVTNFVLISGNDNLFNINEIPGVDFSTTYTIEVAAFINGQWSDYGDPCNITTSPSTSPHARLKGETDANSSPLVTQNIDLLLYPNPAYREKVRLQYSSSNISTRTVTLHTYDITGKRVEENTLTIENGILSNDLNSDLTMKPGIYFVKIIDGNQSVIKKLIIN